jgi:hypothetical protein
VNLFRGSDECGGLLGKHCSSSITDHSDATWAPVASSPQSAAPTSTRAALWFHTLHPSHACAG